MSDRPDEAREYWSQLASAYDRSMLLLGRPVPRMVDLVAEAVHGVPRALEVAAGTGIVTRAIARSAEEVVATDYAEGMVAALSSRVRDEGLTNVRCEQADLYALRFDPGSFGAVVAANVLHLVPDLEGALAALVRVLEPGGRLVVPTFCHGETVVSRAASRLLALTGFPGRRRLTLAALQAAAEAAGVRVTRAERIAGVIPIGYVEGATPA